jgi:SNF2 family DNA or RNA helicase
MLKPYNFQEECIVKLEPHRATLIGDDMGLGKTIEAIELDKRRRVRHNCWKTAQTLIACPYSMTGTWVKELRKWAPHLNVYVYDWKKREEFYAALQARHSNTHPKYHVFIVHWKALSKPQHVRSQMRAVNWFHIIGDEIQNIKNRKAQMTITFKSFPAYYRTALSGTWADNKPTDAWSPLNWLWPDKFRSYNTFENNHVIYKHHNIGTCMAEDCDGYHRTAFKEITGVANVEAIHEAIGSAYVRRTKEEVLKDLPDKYYTQIDVDLIRLQ